MQTSDAMVISAARLVAMQVVEHRRAGRSCSGDAREGDRGTQFMGALSVSNWDIFRGVQEGLYSDVWNQSYGLRPGSSKSIDREPGIHFEKHRTRERRKSSYR
ncbi:hypothetical protein WG66_002609 [Moniliophthora roreri]|nr:hypothetical protein WG66_002609 [Moniliophthora roreri]